MTGLEDGMCLLWHFPSVQWSGCSTMLPAGLKQNFNEQAASREIKPIFLCTSDHQPNMHIKFRYGRVASECL